MSTLSRYIARRSLWGGIIRGKRTTERYARAVQEALRRLRRPQDSQAEVSLLGGRTLQRPLPPSGAPPAPAALRPPERVGIDERFFKRGKGFERRRFVTMVVDQTGCRLLEVADGKQGADVEQAVGHLTGREKVRWVSID